MLSLGLMLAVGLAAIHALTSIIPIPALIPNFRWISFAGGVSIGYVFLEILPELSHAHHALTELEVPLLVYLENHVYILALLGLTVFYGLDILAINSRQNNQINHERDHTEERIFWIHIGVFSLLNLVLGYLMQDLKEHDSWLSCLLFFVAIALHFFILDEHLREHHKALYDRIGRWMLTGSIILGAIVGQTVHLSEAAVAIIWSFLAGSIMLNVLKNELPSEQESCFSSFLIGALLYSGLILAIQNT